MMRPVHSESGQSIVDFKTFIDEHIRLLAEGDAAKMVEHDYHDEAVMVLMLGQQGQVIAGKAALTAQFDMYLKHIYRGFIAIDKLGLSEDSICLEARINTTQGESGVWDVLYMRDGKIFRHYSGIK